jgi:uncharacterized membrane protein YvbJ
MVAKDSELCTVCGNPATSKCAVCGHPVCDEHKKHGFKLRTNDPVVNCPGCYKRRSKKLLIIVSMLLIAFIVISITITIYLINTLPFL